MDIKRFLKWSSTSLQGHVALSALLVSLPLLAIALPRLIAQHSLTSMKLFYVVFLALLLGAIFALLFWLVFTRPARNMWRR